MIGDHTKIDNLVQVLSLLRRFGFSPFHVNWQFFLQIGHNVVIGKCCIICGQVGIAGSATYVYSFIGYMFLLLRIVIWFLWAIFQDSSCYDHADWGTMLHWVVEWQFETMSPLYQRCCVHSSVFFLFFFCLLCAPCIKTRLNFVQHFVALSNVISWLHYSEHSWILLVLIQSCLQGRKLFLSSCWAAEPKKFMCNLCLRIWWFQQIECSQTNDVPCL